MFLSKNKLKTILLSSIIIFSMTGCENNNAKDSTQNINSEVKNYSTEIDVPKDFIEAKVNRVVDGDTVELTLPNNEVVDTRLLLIDTPETKHPKLGVQKFGKEASNFAKETLKEGDTVYFELDGESKTDKYGRYLGYLWYLGDDNTLKMYNEEVVKNGLARVGYIYDQTKHLDRLNEAQDIAKSKKLNIWSIDNYVTDEGYDMSVINDNTSTNIDNNSKSQNSGNIVYINGGKSSSNLYHKEIDSHGMKGGIKINEDDAKNEGYKPCGTCF